MPTLPPEALKEPKDKFEQLARMGAITFISKFFEQLAGYAYSTRSYMPGGLDHTNFSENLNVVWKFCQDRPDWMVEILNAVFADYEPGTTPKLELNRLRESVRVFEAQSGLKLSDYHFHNDKLAKAVRVVMEAESISNSGQLAYNAVHHLVKNLENLTSKVRKVRDGLISEEKNK